MQDGSIVPMDAPVAVKEAVLPFKRFRTRRATSSTRSSARRCARPARSWASTRTSRARSRRARRPRTAACRRAARCSSRSPTATSARSSCPCCGCSQLGFEILATEGTAEILGRNGIPRTRRAQVLRWARSVEGEPSIVDLINARRGRCRDQHAERPQRARRRLRDPHGDRRRRQAAVHDDRAARRRGRVVRGDPGRLRRAEPAGVRARSRRGAPVAAMAHRMRRSFGDRLAAVFARIRPPVRRHRPARRTCFASGACADSATGTARVRPARRRGRAPAGSASSSRRSRSSSATGRPGIAALEDVLAAARAAGLLVIADAKRGDIGTSVEAYAQAWLAPGSPLEADAMTVSAYQGVGSLAAPMAWPEEPARACSCSPRPRTPKRHATQTALVPAASSPRRPWPRVSCDEVNSEQPAAPLGSFGVVIGATVELAGSGSIVAISAAHTDARARLRPSGRGAPRRCRDLFGSSRRQRVVSASRGRSCAAGPDGIASPASRTRRGASSPRLAA